MKIRDIENDFQMYFEDRYLVKTKGKFKEGLVGCHHGLIIGTRCLSDEELDEVLEAEIVFPAGKTPMPGHTVTIRVEGRFPYKNPPRCYPAHNYYTGEPLGKPDVDPER
jgi:hypothetical protein